MKNLFITKHPLIDHSLTILRSKHTGTEIFRRHAAVVSKIIVLEAISKLDVKNIEIETPLSPMIGKSMAEDIVVVPVLRAGLAMLFAVQEFLPSIRVGFIGLERNEETAIAREYYRKFPGLVKNSRVIVLDPMLATGGSFDDTVTALKNKGANSIICVCIVAAPEGIERVSVKHPEVAIYAAAVDEKLNNKKYIVPGLGDFGDRYFGTV